MIINDDVFNVIKTIKDTSISLVFCDPPYNMGTKYYIDPTTGKPHTKDAKDFMNNKWDGLTCEQIETFFKESYRIAKYGAYIVLYGIDRVQMPWEYFAQLAGFEPQQYLYSYKISSFPKSADVGKMLDKKESAEREVIGFNINHRKMRQTNSMCGEPHSGNGVITAPSSDLAKKYDGYKVSISPYKQVLETILIFKKPYPKGMSNIDAIYEYENGNKEISPAIVNIDGGRVPTEENLTINNYGNNSDSGCISHTGGGNHKEDIYESKISNSRYPSQLFIVDDEKLKEEIGYNTSDILDRQRGILPTSSPDQIGQGDKQQKSKGIYGKKLSMITSAYGDEGGCSRINHKCLYSEEEYDILRYCTKVSGKERTCNGEIENNHPTLKNLELNFRIIQLFTCPSENLKDFTVFNPFSGAGSEYIGLLSNGVLENNIIACELNDEFYNISLARIKYWKDKKFIFRKEDKNKLESSKKQDIKKHIF